MVIDTLIRSKRRTIALVVERDATLTVRAPHKVSLEYIMNLVMRKHAWIEKKKQQASRQVAVPSKNYVDGETFLYLGKEYVLRVCYGKHIELVEETSTILFPRKFLPHATKAMTLWYKKMAREVMRERATLYVQATSWQYTSLAITSAKTRWGSCSSKGSINFTWRLVMAPLATIDYVVVHELAHLGEQNHSGRFWQKVERVLPHYKQEEAWLKERGKFLQL